MPRSVVSAWMPQHPLLDVTAFHSEQDGSWFALLNDTLSIPFLVSVLFICFQVLNGLAVFVAYVTRRPSITPQEAELLESNSQTEHPATLWQWARNQVDYLGGKTITSYLAARFFYASVLAFISLTVKKWSVLATRGTFGLWLSSMDALKMNRWRTTMGQDYDAFCNLDTHSLVYTSSIHTSRSEESYANPVIMQGYRVPHLSYEQLPPLSDSDYASYLTGKAFPHLDPFRGGKKPHLFFGLMRVFRKEYTILALTLVGQGLFQFLAPIGINRILNYLETGGENADIRPWFWILCIFAGPAIRAIFFSGLIFEHSLRIRLRSESSSETSKGQASESYTSTVVGTPETAKSKVAGSSSSSPSISQDMAKEVPNEGKNLIGKINNLVTTDLTNIVEARDFLVLFLFILFKSSYLFSSFTGCSDGGLGAMVVLFPIPGYIAKRMQDLQKLKMNKSDARIQDVTEAVNILRMIKLFGWEEKIAKRIEGRREDELNVLWRFKCLEWDAELCNTHYRHGGHLRRLHLNHERGTQPLVPLLAKTYVIHEIHITLIASKIFSSMAVFSILRIQLFRTSSLIQYVITGKVSLDRLNDFLKRTELLDSFVETDAQVVTPAQELPQTSGWVLDSQNINLIIGPTGSGKTALLMALLGEMHFIRSSADSWFNLPREGGIAYAAQESWVLNETIRENILFGLPYDEDRYRKVIQQCALEKDLELFEAGDQTEVGEKGLTLSGGQKASLSLDAVANS
ncbi:hypothetical protein CPB84DRAFT_1853036 [Gymnopilus junonius]|uniref:ABC transmembrane type-1 domain-containing protein n=1 Tax=Gymnopilus junonius TaxID=109634 RepID=A0A9P5NAX9_GYMJU|nr:hypothetical protein CPB84DRAFT_1853036 [Gymnopilus junonius]